MFKKMIQNAQDTCINAGLKLWHFVILPCLDACIKAFHKAWRLCVGIPSMSLKTVFKIVVVGLALIGVLKLIPPLSTRGSEQLPVLHEVKRESQDPQPAAERGVIVFIHGLGGDSQETWRASKDTPTFMKLMAEDPDLSRYDIYTLGYGAQIFSNKGRFETAVQSLKDHLDNKWRDSRHIVIVAHSLGGLVAQHAIALSDLGSQERLHQTLTFISLATPFRGSEIADLLKNLTTAGSVNMDVLDTKNELSIIGSRYWKKCCADCGGRLVHFAGFEKKSLIITPVVNEESANATVGPGFAFGFDGDHFTICKPKDRESKVYQVVRNWIINQEAQRIEWAKLPETVVLQPGNRYVLARGDHIIKKDIDIPIGAKLEIQPGANLTFVDGAVLHCRGKLFAGVPLADVADTDRQKQLLEQFAPVTFRFEDSALKEGAVMLQGPHTASSYLNKCEFLDGRGVSIDKPNPRVHAERTDGKGWHDVVKRDPTKSRYGGAVLIVGAEHVDFRDCTFRQCQAWQGGAVMLVGSKRVTLDHCTLVSNHSGYGGGAVYLQDSEAYVSRCVFQTNSTGLNYRKPGHSEPEKSQNNACGGAVYVGYNSYVDLHSCRFIKNEAEYVGGAAYYLGEYRSFETIRQPICSQCFFARNHCEGQGGGALHLDQQASLNITSCRFVANQCTDDPSQPGQDILDASNTPIFSNEHRSGLVFNGDNTFFRSSAVHHPPASVSPTQITLAKVSFPQGGLAPPWMGDDVAVSRHPPQLLRIRHVHDSLITNPECFRRGEPDARKIDTIVIHHVSAIRWDSDSLLKGMPVAVLENIEEGAGVKLADEPRYEVRRCKRIFEMYGVSSHYLIDRNGNVFRLVEDKDIAFHAGKSRMPEPDGREDVNEFSLGIELVASHPDDDPTITKDNQYTPAQYFALRELLVDLCTKYEVPLEHVVGHDDIAVPTGRKKDPGPFFKWPELRKDLATDLGGK